MNKLIFITGEQGSGKTTFANELMNSDAKYLLMDGAIDAKLINRHIKDNFQLKVNTKSNPFIEINTIDVIIISNCLKIDDIDFKFFDSVINVECIRIR